MHDNLQRIKSICSRLIRWKANRQRKKHISRDLYWIYTGAWKIAPLYLFIYYHTKHMKTTYKMGGETVHSFREYNETTWNFEKDWKTVKFMGENYRKSQLSIDIYNILMTWIKERNDKSPEHLTMCKILRDRGETELLYSLLVNI